MKYNNDIVTNRFQLLINGINTGATANKSEFNKKTVPDSNGWFNVQIYLNTKTKTQYVYVNGILYKSGILSKLEGNRANSVNLGLIRTECSGGDVEFDDIMFKFISEKKFCEVTGTIPSEKTEQLRLITKGRKLLGMGFDVNNLPAENNKFITAIYETDKDAVGNIVKTKLNGVAITTLTQTGEYEVIFNSPITVEAGNIINIYLWNIGNLTPIYEAVNPLE